MKENFKFVQNNSIIVCMAHPSDNETRTARTNGGLRKRKSWKNKIFNLNLSPLI